MRVRNRLRNSKTQPLSRYLARRNESEHPNRHRRADGSARRNYPTRVNCAFRKQHGRIVPDQIRTIDKTRLMKKLGIIDSKAQSNVVSVLQRMFAF